MHSAIFPGSFDPITIGHYDIIKRSRNIFEKVYIAIGMNTTKPRYFHVDLCIRMIKEVFKDDNGIEVIHYDGLTVDICKKLDVRFVIRGIRNVSDFEYERSLSEMNRALNPLLETIFFDSRPDFVTISSTIIRDVHKNGGDITKFVPKEIMKFIQHMQ
jgi:pantetheine-phosphate adenylyltransferase